MFRAIRAAARARAALRTQSSIGHPSSSSGLNPQTHSPSIGATNAITAQPCRSNTSSLPPSSTSLALVSSITHQQDDSKRQEQDTKHRRYFNREKGMSHLYFYCLSNT